MLVPEGGPPRGCSPCVTANTKRDEVPHTAPLGMGEGALLLHSQCTAAGYLESMTTAALLMRIALTAINFRLALSGAPEISAKLLRDSKA